MPIPYAKAAVDYRGKFFVICPKCGLWCRGKGSTEDEITKSAADAYRDHHQLAHVELKVHQR